MESDHAQHFGYERTDRLMRAILFWHAVAIVLWAGIIYLLKPAEYYPSPFSWRDLSGGEVLAAISIAVLAAVIPWLLRASIRDRFIYQILVTCALSVMSFTIVFITGGAIEAHFHIFAVLTVITLYYDQRLAWTVLGLVVVHRVLFNAIDPLWLYNYGRNDMALVAHTFFVLLAAGFAAYIAQQGFRSMQTIVQANQLLARKVGE
jgi:hypothetical protein